MVGWSRVIDMKKSEIQKLITPYLLRNTESYVVVFVDGIVIADLIPEQTLPQTLGSVSLSQQTCLTIKQGVFVPRPIHLLFVTTQNHANDAAKHYQNKIIVGAGSEVGVIEEHVVLNDAVQCHNITTHIHAKNKAKVVYSKIFNVTRAKQEAHLQLSLDAESNITTNHLIFGEVELQEKITVQLAHERALCVNNGLYDLAGNSKLFLDIAIWHIANDCESKVFFKGIATDVAQANFSGQITVREGALRTKARLDNKNLLLQDTARIVSSPALEIYADDVQCSHGATVGQLDAQALWYLQSRGIDADMAKQMLTQAFVHEIIYALPKFLQEKTAHNMHFYPVAR